MPRIKLIIAVLMLSIFFSLALHAESLADRVKSALDQQPPSGRYELIIESKGSKVILEGSVAKAEISSEIEKVVSQVEGVSLIDNRLLVNSSSQNSNLDQPSTATTIIKRALNSDSQLRDYTVSIHSDGNTVTLSGQVTTQADFDRVEQIVSGVSKAKIVNNINVIPKKVIVDDYVLYQRVLSALENQTDAKGLQISAKKGIVTVSGKVENHRQLDKLLSLILMVEGVEDIKNQTLLEAN